MCGRRLSRLVQVCDGYAVDSVGHSPTSEPSRLARLVEVTNVVPLGWKLSSERKNFGSLACLLNTGRETGNMYRSTSESGSGPWAAAGMAW